MNEDVCVVVPTVRNPDCVRDYADNARANGHLDRLFVVLVTEDFCDAAAMREMLDEEGLSGAVFDGSRREAWFRERGLDDYAHLIPEASHAQTSFGLLYLYDQGFEYGVFLDDDTRPHPDFDFFGGHLKNIAHEGPVEVRNSDQSWVNVLDGVADLYPRGYPYGAMDERTDRRVERVENVAVSQGLWTGVPDLDAVRILSEGDVRGQGRTRLTREDYGPDPDFVTAPGCYLTVCSMNLAFRREVIPAFYQLPMDDNPWDVGRFDDIWSGIFCKRACDVLDRAVLSGTPLCVHEKAPRSTFSDLRSEAPALELNEHLWRAIDGVGGDADSFREVFAAMADELATGDPPDHENGEFLRYVGEYMFDWLDCLDALAARRVPADD